MTLKSKIPLELDRSPEKKMREAKEMNVMGELKIISELQIPKDETAIIYLPWFEQIEKISSQSRVENFNQNFQALCSEVFYGKKSNLTLTQGIFFLEQVGELLSLEKFSANLHKKNELKLIQDGLAQLEKLFKQRRFFKTADEYSCDLKKSFLQRTAG